MIHLEGREASKAVKSCDTCKHDEAFGCPSFIHDRCENYSEWEQADREYFCEDYSCIEIEKNCENCEYFIPSESNDNVCRNCDNKSNWKLKQAQADGEYQTKKSCETCKYGETFNLDCARCDDDMTNYAPKQADGDIITALCSLPKIQSEDRQDYVQLADVLETVRRYKPSVAIPNKVGHWIKNADEGQNIDPPYICSECGNAEIRQRKFCAECGCPMEIDIDGMASDKLTTEDGEPDGVGQIFCP